MQSLNPHPERPNRATKESLNLDVLVLYDDLQTGLRASQSLHRALHELEPPVDIRVNFLRADLFSDPALLPQLTARSADIVFVSTHAQARLPANLDSWLRDWFDRQTGKPRALAVLVDERSANSPGAARLLDDLSSAARMAGVDVFLPQIGPESQWKSALDEIHHRAETRSLLLDAVLHQAEHPPLREWGLNE